MSASNEGRSEPQMVTFTDIARLAVEHGFTDHLTRQGVRKMADTDPAWPVPEEQWMKIGNAWAMPWAPVKKYLAERTWTGRGPSKEAPAVE
jgi:hypothetical protein